MSALSPILTLALPRPLPLTSFYFFNISFSLSLPLSNYFRFCLQYPLLPSLYLFIYLHSKSPLPRSLQCPPRLPPCWCRWGPMDPMTIASESDVHGPRRRRHVSQHPPLLQWNRSFWYPVGTDGFTSRVIPLHMDSFVALLLATCNPDGADRVPN
jgi:hypothetical protein